MGKLKQFGWLVLRVCILGPLAMVIVLGEWCSESFYHVEKLLNELEDK